MKNKRKKSATRKTPTKGERPMTWSFLLPVRSVSINPALIVYHNTCSHCSTVQEQAWTPQDSLNATQRPADILLVVEDKRHVMISRFLQITLKTKTYSWISAEFEILEAAQVKGAIQEYNT